VTAVIKIQERVVGKLKLIKSQLYQEKHQNFTYGEILEYLLDRADPKTMTIQKVKK
jgi:hypothetical protein